MGGMSPPLVADERWAAVEPLLPPEPPKPAAADRERVHRRS
jgi:hypothetical protein